MYFGGLGWIALARYNDQAYLGWDGTLTTDVSRVKVFASREEVPEGYRARQKMVMYAPDGRVVWLESWGRDL